MSEDEARRRPARVDQMSFDRLIRIADRLGQVQAGSPAADQAIHQALDRSGPVLAYTEDEDAAQSLYLPASNCCPPPLAAEQSMRLAGAAARMGSCRTRTTGSGAPRYR